MNKAPFNISLLDVDRVIKEENIKEVTSEFIKESSTNRFHPEGLFSEQIFGDIASQKRIETCGYIKLNCRVFHPVIYQNLQAIKRFYVEIMAGTKYAIWDADEADFVRASESEQGADTGYAFFMKYFDKINFEKNTSLKRGDKIDVINKFKNLRTIDKIIVIPAGIRDMKEDQGRMEKDSVNSLYSSLLRNAKSMTKGADTNPLFDTVHYTIQKRVVEIYEKVAEIVRGKHGFFEGRYSHRNIARGTRNVVTATDMDAASPDSPQYHKVDECKVPLFQAAKAAANLLVYWYKTLFYDQVVNMSSENVPLIDQKTLRLEYVPLELKDKDLMLTAEGIEKTIDRFRDPFNRFKPVTARSSDKYYYVFMVYDRGDRIHIVRNVDEFKTNYVNSGHTWDDKCLRPITHAEMLYICSYFAYKGTHATCTRYPVADEQSIFISKTHLVTTSPSRIVRLMQNIEDDPEDQILPEYPVKGGSFIDALMLHPTRLKSLNADFDGNCLVGETRVEVRYTDAWFKMVCDIYQSDKNHNTDQDIKEALNQIDLRVYAIQKGWNYAEIKMEDMPQLGEYTLDKNGARVYDIPDGIEILSYRDGAPTYLPITKVTVEDNCSVAKIMCGGRSAIVSTNPSLAAFNNKTGELDKIAPSKIDNRLTPYFRKSIRFESNDLNTYNHGYNLGQMITNMNEVNGFFARIFTDDCCAGYFAAVVDKLGSIQSVTDSNITFIFEVEKPDDMKYLERLLYTMGIRYSYVVSGDKCMMIIPSGDLIAYDKVLRFKNKLNQANLNKWRTLRRSTNSDTIPITEEEKLRIERESVGHLGLDDITRLSSLRTNRRALKNYVKRDDSPLSNRIYNDSVCWDTTMVVPLKEKRRVYDFIVPGTKVFAVNNGLIVFDTCSWIPIFGEESNAECEAYIHTPGNYILPSGEPLADMCDDLVKISFFAMSRDTPELKK